MGRIGRTKREITLEFRNHGEITIPKGHPVSSTCDASNDWFVEDIDRIANRTTFLWHDAYYYGIRIKDEDVE